MVQGLEHPPGFASPICKCGSGGTCPTHYWRRPVQSVHYTDSRGRRIDQTIKRPKVTVKVIQSVALWCDDGRHAFSSKDKTKKRRVETTESDDRYGDTIKEEEEFYTCGPCLEKMKNLLDEAQTALSEKTKNLETWNDGYEAGKAAAGAIEG